MGDEIPVGVPVFAPPGEPAGARSWEVRQPVRRPLGGFRMPRSAAVTGDGSPPGGMRWAIPRGPAVPAAGPARGDEMAVPASVSGG